MNAREKIYFFFAKHSRTWKLQRYFEKKLARSCGKTGNGGFAYSTAIRLLYKEKHGLQIGYGTFGGCFLNPGLFWRGIRIGNYCSIADGLTVLTANHPMDFYTTHPVAYCEEYGAPKGHDIQWGELSIGNGVWMGNNVIILPGCKQIGDQAIIGAGSVVTHNVPPYAVVAGNPARLIRYRFSEDKRSRLDATRWWEKEWSVLAHDRDKLNELCIRY